MYATGSAENTRDLHFEVYGFETLSRYKSYLLSLVTSGLQHSQGQEHAKLHVVKSPTMSSISI